MTGSPRLTFFVDVDNTLLDNDDAKREMDHRLLELLGERGAARFWEIYEEVRAELTVVDIPRTLARYSADTTDRDLRFLLAELFMSFPFKDFVYPGSAPAIAHMQTMGRVAILSDGDAIFQIAKITRSGLADAVGGYALIYAHKEEHLAELMGAFPADHYVLVDDKPGVIERLGAKMTEPLTTVFVRQGKYAGAVPPGDWPGAGITIAAIGDLCRFDRDALIAAGRGNSSLAGS
jgi:FMN phosphatase YigB (HAD superfamily)